MKPGHAPDDETLQALYREAVAQDQDAPSAELDARILSAAHAAAAAQAKRTARPSLPWWKRWLLPVSITAVAILGVSLSLHMSEEVAQLDALKAGDQFRAIDTPAQTSAEQAGAAPERAASAPLLRTPAKTAAAKAPPAALRDQAPAARRRMEAPATPKMEAEQASERRSSAPARMQAKEATNEADAVENSPERWLTEIRALRRSGRNDEAAAQLARFRQRYPDYPLPPDMK